MRQRIGGGIQEGSVKSLQSSVVFRLLLVVLCADHIYCIVQTELCSVQTKKCIVHIELYGAVEYSVKRGPCLRLV